MRIRPMTDEDFDAVVRVWHAAGLATYTFIDIWQQLTFEKAREVFREHVAKDCEVWVAETTDGIVAYSALQGSYLARLYVDPRHQRRGFGLALLEHAKSRSPTGLELHTHVKNVGARAFYERHGFVVVKFGISPPPENEPDVEYHWRPVDNS